MNEEPPIELPFEVLPEHSPVSLTLATSDGQLLITADRLDDAAELIQHLSAFLNVQQLAADIEASESAIQSLLSLVHSTQELQAVRQRLTVDMANQVSVVRNLYADAEAARLLCDTAEMRRYYASIAGENRQLAGQQGVRRANYTQLMDCLKRINLHVQHAARCRGMLITIFYLNFYSIFPFKFTVGKYQTDVVGCTSETSMNNIIQ